MISTTQPTSSKPTATLAALSLVCVVYALVQSIVGPALSTIQHDHGATESGVAWVLSGTLLSAAVATPILGRLGDIHGKRKVLLLTLAGMALGTFLAAIATSLSLLIAGRIVQGVGGGLFPLSFGIVRDEFPRERVNGSIGFLSALLGLGTGLGVVFSGLIVDNLSYTWIFWIPLGLAILAFVATALVVPESPVRAERDINWLGALLMSLGLASILLAISQTHVWGWGSTKTLGLIAAGAIVLAAWVRVELRAKSPLVDMRIMARRGVWTTNVAAVLMGLGMFTAYILIPQFAQMSPSAGFGFGSSVTAAAMFLLPLSMMMLLIGILAGSLERRFGSKRLLLAGVASAIVAYVLMLTSHDSALPIYIASGALGAGIGLAFAAMSTLIVQAVPPEQTGVATGVNAVARWVGAAFGGQLAATFVASSVAASGLPTVEGYEHAFEMALLALLVCFGAALLVPARTERQSASDVSTAPAPA